METLIKKLREKMRILNSVTVPQNVKGGPWDFLTSIVWQIIKTIEGGIPWCNSKVWEKSLIVPKKV